MLLLGLRAGVHHDPISQPTSMLIEVSYSLRFNLGTPAVVDSEQFEIHGPTTSEETFAIRALRPLCRERSRELRDSIERKLLMRVSSDLPRKRGRSVGRHAAMTATPASTCDHTSMFVIRAYCFFLVLIQDT